jgi:tetratricopeptide (TPR) repeat protein
MYLRLASTLSATIVAAVALTPSEAIAQRSLDQVFLTKGAPARGDIPDNGMTRDKVMLETTGNAREIAVNDIVRITFKEEPAELNAARTSVLQKNYNQALTDLKKLDGQKIDREFIRQDIDFYRALSLARLAMSEGGDKAAAAEATRRFATSAPQNYHFYEAAEVLGDLAMASGKWADAAKFYGPITTAPWPDYQMRANNAQGRALIGEKKFDEALEKFKAVLGMELATPEALKQKNFAQVGRAICVAETGNPQEAITALQDLINKNDAQDTALFARAYNALGRCYLKLDKPKDALLALLHTDTLFYADSEAHAEALYHLSKLWTTVNKSDRGVAARNTLRERYAGSVWATLD